MRRTTTPRRIGDAGRLQRPRSRLPLALGVGGGSAARQGAIDYRRLCDTSHARHEGLTRSCVRCASELIVSGPSNPVCRSASATVEGTRGRYRRAELVTPRNTVSSLERLSMVSRLAQRVGHSDIVETAAASAANSSSSKAQQSATKVRSLVEEHQSVLLPTFAESILSANATRWSDGGISERYSMVSCSFLVDKVTYLTSSCRFVADRVGAFTGEDNVGCCSYVTGNDADLKGRVRIPSGLLRWRPRKEIRTDNWRSSGESERTQPKDTSERYAQADTPCDVIHDPLFQGFWLNSSEGLLEERTTLHSSNRDLVAS